MVAAGIDVHDCEPAAPNTTGSSAGRGFPVSGGVAAALADRIGDDGGFVPVIIDGLDKKSLKLCDIYINKKAPGNFLEVMACEGGCVCGPGAVAPPNLARKSLTALLEKSG